MCLVHCWYRLPYNTAINSYNIMKITLSKQQHITHKHVCLITASNLFLSSKSPSLQIITTSLLLIYDDNANK